MTSQSQISKASLALQIDSVWAISGVYATVALQLLQGFDASYMRESSSDSSGDLYDLVDGIAVIPITGPMTKADTSMSWLLGGTSTIAVRQALRAAERDPEVRQIALLVDSPGGQVSGTAGLAAQIAKTKAIKPVLAYIDDQCCSAALWVAAQASEVIASPFASAIGSIGVYGTVVDSSRRAENEGFSVTLISTGGIKGHPTPGVSVPDDVVAEYQKIVDKRGAEFAGWLEKGRGMEDARPLMTGQVWCPQEALSLGLIDRIAEWDEVLEELREASASQQLQAASSDLSNATTDNKGGPMLQAILAKFLPGRGGGGQGANSVPPMTEEELAATHLEAELVAMSEAVVTAHVDTALSGTIMAPEMRSLAEKTLKAALLADGGGLPPVVGGKVVPGAHFQAAQELVSRIPADARLGDTGLSPISGPVVIVNPGEAASDIEKTKTAYRKKMESSVGKRGGQ